MRGLVFTEFLEMVESVFGDDMVDTIIDITQPPSGGAYTSVGSYDYSELENMIAELSAQTDISVAELLEQFGRHLGAVFSERYARFFIQAGSALCLFQQVGRHLHREVKKLYPDEELPEFSYENATADMPFKIHYRSDRNLHKVATGLIQATCDYYSEPHHIKTSVWREQNKYCCTFELSPFTKESKQPYVR